MQVFCKYTFLSVLLLLFSAFNISADTVQKSLEDPYLWLEEQKSDQVMEWVADHNDKTMNNFRDDPNFQNFQNEILKLFNAGDKIPYGVLRGKYIYNFWQNNNHDKGILRRTTLEEYKSNDPKWETVLDIDKINVEEGKEWVYVDSNCLPPDYTRCMIALSEGGSEDKVYREYDFDKKEFIEGGFILEPARSVLSWYDIDTLLVATRFGKGSLTTSQYPRTVKLWKRYEDINDAKVLIEIPETEVLVEPDVKFRPEGKFILIKRAMQFYSEKNYLVDLDLNKESEIALPENADVYGFFNGYLIFSISSPSGKFSKGSLLAVKTDDLKSKDLLSKSELIYAPEIKTVVENIYFTKNRIIVKVIKNSSKNFVFFKMLRSVRSKILYFSIDDKNFKFKINKGELKLPDIGLLNVVSSNDYSDTVIVSFQNFLNPTRLYLYESLDQEPVIVKSLPARFDSTGYKIYQFYAKSADGTRVPYFLVGPKDLDHSGNNPTLLYGYGGFNISQLPFYSGFLGNFWFKKGGLYVLANVRGGGEFGADWHKGAILSKRQNAFDDFIAVAEDLIAKKLTSPDHLGIMGGSNGGLLVGAVMTQRPELFNAVVCQVPLLDMLRYTKLGAGASWIGEYGDPDDPFMRRYIERYSPYQNLVKGEHYPAILFETSTKDNKVHPGHARKMAARMEEFGNEVYYYEETEGGHSISIDGPMTARRQALEFAFLVKQLFH